MTRRIEQVQSEGHLRPAAVAGHFYPENGDKLRAMVRGFLAPPSTGGETPRCPKAIIAPHAGLIYSGAPAGAVYRRLKPFAAQIERIVLVGPNHRVPVQGIAASSAASFATPMGRVPIDRKAVERACEIRGVEVNDLAHKDEHCLEVHLPFLIEILPSFELVPLLVGHDPENICAQVLQTLWGGPETLIIISSDLSHYLDYDTARAMDQRTCDAIMAFDGDRIGREQACGRAAIRGILNTAQARGLGIETVALCNSGDTAGPRDRVVGYGSWIIG